jgi:hypothetical protein
MSPSQGHQALFQDYQALSDPKTILLGDNNPQSVLGHGSVLLKLNSEKSLLTKNILYVPSLAKNLLFVAQITSTCNTIITFIHDKCIIKTTTSTSQKLSFQINKEGNLFS